MAQFPRSDINTDGIIDIEDFSILSNNFLLECPLSVGGNGKWPRLYGTSGPYAVSSDNNFSEIADLASDGHDIAFMNYSAKPGFSQQTSAHGVKYVDRKLQSLLYAACKKLGMSLYNPYVPCPIDQDVVAQAELITKVREYLALPEISSDQQLVGFWILDDPPGDVHQTLGLIKQEIVKAAAPFPRPTVCGFASTPLSYKNGPGGEFVDYFDYFDKGVVNFDPRACDIAMFYSYAERSRDANIYEPELQDWRMERTLQRALEKIRTQGKSYDPSWDQNTLVWGGMITTFGNKQPPYRYIPPRLEDMRTQSEAFCVAGASIISFYPWHDSKGDEWSEPFNNSVMREGAKQARVTCQQYW